MPRPRLMAGRGVPMGLVGMVALIASAETFLGRYELDVAGNTTSAEWREIGESIPGKAAGSDVLCFGDSLAKMAISPILMEQRSGLKAYNLSISGGRAPTSYFLLRRAIDSGIRPKAVLVDFKWSALERTVIEAQQPLTEVAGPRDHLDYATTVREPSVFATLMIAEALTSYRCRFEVRKAVTSALEGRSASIRDHVQGWYRSWQRNRGAHHTPSTPAFNGVINTADLNVYRPAWKPLPVNVKYVDRFLKLASDRGIRVYWMITPISPNAQAWREANGPDAAYSEFVRRFQARYPGLVVVDGRKSGYPDAAFYDATHLNRRGTAAFTTEVARAIRRGESGDPDSPRWVGVAAFRDAPGADSFEDVIQSFVALREPPAAPKR